ncbi:hypothetical protein [Nocardioides sp.]|uniref:hypothetical protein n=1 Tax=Nocardioides sp. TaxID=35761 RepID=UPI003783597B
MAVRVSDALVDEIVGYLQRDRVRAANGGYVRPSVISRELRRSVGAVDAALRCAIDRGRAEGRPAASRNGIPAGWEYRARPC